MACGDAHSHILSAEGYVYSMGSNEDGRLGIGQTFKELQVSVSPRLVEKLSQVKVIAAGGSHSIAITSNYEVYGWGSAENGAIGMRLSSTCSPIEIILEADQKQAPHIKDAACGAKHSLFLTSKRQELLR